MKFIADEMLGKLAKWLRIFGLDTLYLPHIKDGELLRLSIVEKRVLLTRDKFLIKRKGVKGGLFIFHDCPFDQIKQVVKELGLHYPHNPFSRCIVCNTPLIPYSREEACRIVPEYVCKTREVFGQCPQCKKVYWKGTHYERMGEMLDRLFNR